MDALVLAGIVLALLFTFANGLVNAGTAIATPVATRSLSPERAVVLAAAANFVGPFVLATAVARTIGTGIVNPDSLTPLILTTALATALALLLLSASLGFPVSANQSLIGGLIGAAIASGGLTALILPDPAALQTLTGYALLGAFAGGMLLGAVALSLKMPVRIPVLAGMAFGISIAITALLLRDRGEITGLLAIVVFILISPVLGFLAACLFNILISHLFRHSSRTKTRRIFQPLQILAAAFQGVGHGSHDGQIAAGMISALLLSAGFVPAFTVSTGAIAASAAVIALGTLFGGWRVVKRLAMEITRIRPYQGFTASAAGGAVIVGATLIGMPLSSMQVISGSIIGVGATRGVDAVQWSVVRGIVAAWIVTIPLAALISWLLCMLVLGIPA
ncbi:MAG: inorganic phosphate transporter [Methanomicrobiales archaeon]|nr:inorganic phosphate transporter [Methanomicrobiales archaeon]